MKQILLLFSLAFVLLPSQHAAARSQKYAQPMQCVAFSPYVGQFNPDYGPHPSKEEIETLLDVLVKQTPFRCIMTYGVLNGLDATFAAARDRGIKVIAIVWIDKDSAVNTASIARGITLAKAFPNTIIKLSCGSEVRTRHGEQFDGEIMRCIDTMHEAKVRQPVTTIDTWWEWCNRSTPCGQTRFSSSVDWIGINIFPWWENKHAGVFTCLPAAKAADFHLARLADVQRTNPDKQVIITEFGWPYAPEGGTETNVHTGEQCGIAGRDNQLLVIRSTLHKLTAQRESGIVFEAFSESWKSGEEGQFGAAWGICSSEPPYRCIDLKQAPGSKSKPTKSKRKK